VEAPRGPIRRALFVFLALAFPLVLILAWAQETKSVHINEEKLDLGPDTNTGAIEAHADAQQSNKPLEAFPRVRLKIGNLPAIATSFVGRASEVEDIKEQLKTHRLVTLTGVGGVGKTRLAMTVAEQSKEGFPDGVWLAELAPLGDPSAVPPAVAAALGVTPQGGRTINDAITEALSDRQLLLVLDNCEHVLDAAGDLVETLLAGAPSVSVIATSREGLRVNAEHLWPVPSLDVRGGAASAAVALFVDRAKAANPEFDLGEDAEVVADICKRLDGIALAIELAAARMVSMSPLELLERLTDRFRLLSGSRRGLERHQTLRQAVQWSYDLLEDDERQLLQRCSVFADGFNLAAATYINSADGGDEYAALDVLDSLVRKSLITTENSQNQTRYGMLETIRQFSEEQLAQSGDIDYFRERHARYYAEQAKEWWHVWEGPRQREALEWVAAELANLRIGFDFATDRGALEVAANIAAHSAVLAFPLQQFEPTVWAEKLIPAARAAELPQLGRLYGAAVLCAYVGREKEAAEYGRAAVALQQNDHYDSFESGWNEYWTAIALAVDESDMKKYVETCREISKGPGSARTMGLFGMVYVLPACGLADEAMKIADEAEKEARANGNPFWIGWLYAGNRAFTEADPERAKRAFQDGLAYTRQQLLPFAEHRILQELAWLEVMSGKAEQALLLFDEVIDAFHRAGNEPDLAATLCYLSMFFDRLGDAETAAVIFGGSGMARESWVVGMPDALDSIQNALGAEKFEACVERGVDMEIKSVVPYAREQIQKQKIALANSS
jgi:predicted ATPase